MQRVGNFEAFERRARGTAKKAAGFLYGSTVLKWLKKAIKKSDHTSAAMSASLKRMKAFEMRPGGQERVQRAIKEVFC